MSDAILYSVDTSYIICPTTRPDMYVANTAKVVVSCHARNANVYLYNIRHHDQMPLNMDCYSIDLPHVVNIRVCAPVG